MKISLKNFLSLPIYNCPFAIYHKDSAVFEPHFGIDFMEEYVIPIFGDYIIDEISLIDFFGDAYLSIKLE